MNLSDVYVDIYLGTWCVDSKKISHLIKSSEVRAVLGQYIPKKTFYKEKAHADTWDFYNIYTPKYN
jgi:hypothetical protein